MRGGAVRWLACSVLWLAMVGCGSGSGSPGGDSGRDVGIDPGTWQDVPVSSDGSSDREDTTATDPGSGSDVAVPDGESADDAMSPSDAPEEASPDLWNDPGEDSGEDPGLDQAWDPGSDSEEDIGSDLTADPGTDPGPVHRECAVDNGGCSPYARCIDGFPQPDCYCATGWEGDGITCTNVDECARGMDVCDEHATCEDVPGTYACHCLPGYEGNGYSCLDINECLQMPWVCGPGAWCSNEEGGYSCACNQGLATDGDSCRWTLEESGAGQDYVEDLAVDRQGNAFLLVGTDGVIGLSDPPHGGKDIAVVHYTFEGFQDWVMMIGSNAIDWPGGIVTDSQGNFYVVGTAGGSLDGQPTPGWADAFVGRYDPSGRQEWILYLGTEAYEGATGVALHGDSLYVAGFTSGTMPTQSSAGGDDAFVARVQLDGTPLWYRQVGSSARDRATAIAVGSSGQVFLAGTSEGAIGDAVSQGGIDAFLVSLDADGNVGWSRQWGTWSNDDIRGLAVDAEGGVWAVGMAAGSLDSQTPLGGTDAYVLRYDSQGNRTFLTQFGGAGSDFGYDVVTDPEGAWVVTQVGQGLGDQAGIGQSDMALVHFDATGARGAVRILGTKGRDKEGASLARVFNGGLRLAFTTYGDLGSSTERSTPDVVAMALNDAAGTVWERQTGSRVWTSGSRMTLAADDTIYVVGETKGDIGGTGQPGGGKDVFLMRVRPNGWTDWVRQVGTGYDESSAGVALAGDHLVLVGSSAGLPDGNPNPNGIDVLLASFTVDGTPGPVVTWGSSSLDQARAATGTENGDVYVVGTTLGTVGETSMGQEDMFAAKFSADLQPVWVRQLGTESHDYWDAVARHPEGGIVVAGSTSGFLAGVVNVSGTGATRGAIVARYDADGNRRWLVSVGSQNSDSALALAVAPNGDVLVAGDTYGTLAEPSQGGPDIFVMRLEPNYGHLLWVHQFGTAGSDLASGIALGPGGSLYVSGVTDGTLADPADGTGAAGGKDVVLIRMEADGSNAVQWQIGTTRDDVANAVAVDSLGNPLLLGETGGSFLLPTAIEVTQLFLMKR